MGLPPCERAGRKDRTFCQGRRPFRLRTKRAGKPPRGPLWRASARGRRGAETAMKQVEAGVIGTGWCGGIRAETLSRSALVDKLHICEIRPDRLAEVKALTRPATATLDYQDLVRNDAV